MSPTRSPRRVAWAAAWPRSSRAPAPTSPACASSAVDVVRPNPRQPRRDFDEEALLALAESIRSRGLLQPIVVRPLAGGTFELVAGERRLRAARLAGLERLPAVVRDAEDWERLDLALAENMARVDLNPIEEARACAMLVEDLGLTKGEVGRRVGKSRVAVSNLIRLLELPDEALELIEAGALSEGHGRAILLSKDHERAQAARPRGARRRLVCPRDRAPRPARRAGPRAKPAEERWSCTRTSPTRSRAAEDALQAALGTEVKVRARGTGCRAEIDFDDPAEAIALAERCCAPRRSPRGPGRLAADR